VMVRWVDTVCVVWLIALLMTLKRPDQLNDEYFAAEYALISSANLDINNLASKEHSNHPAFSYTIHRSWLVLNLHVQSIPVSCQSTRNLSPQPSSARPPRSEFGRRVDLRSTWCRIIRRVTEFPLFNRFTGKETLMTTLIEMLSYQTTNPFQYNSQHIVSSSLTQPPLPSQAALNPYPPLYRSHYPMSDKRNIMPDSCDPVPRSPYS
jgi:hypothetical protein